MPTTKKPVGVASTDVTAVVFDMGICASNADVAFKNLKISQIRETLKWNGLTESDRKELTLILKKLEKE